MNIGVLTGGGDVPGLNAAIRAVVGRASDLQHEVIGIRSGWRGAMEAEGHKLAWSDVSALVSVGGTTLGTSRTNPLASEKGFGQLMSGLERLGIQGLVAIGGDDTLGVARELARAGFRTVAVPKTMDNDVGGTDWTIGFFTAAGIACEAAERLRTTAQSHRRVLILEVMGRHAGWVALVAGLGAAADLVLIPEVVVDVTDIAKRLQRHYQREGHAVIVVAEGVTLGGAQVAGQEVDQFGHARLGGVGERLAYEIRNLAEVDTRAVSLGHIQRGGPPALYDRMLGTALGAYAVDILDRGKSGLLAGWHGERPAEVSLEEALAKPKLVNEPWVELLCSLQRSVGC